MFLSDFVEKKTDLPKTDWQKVDSKLKGDKGPIRISTLMFIFSELIHFREKWTYDSKIISNFERMLVLKLRENTGDYFMNFSLIKYIKCIRT